MTAVNKNAVINTRHQKGLTECSRGVAHSPSALTVLAGFRALQQLPLSRCQRRPASAVPGRSSPPWLPKLPSKPGLGMKPPAARMPNGVCWAGGPGAALALEVEWLCGGSGSGCPPRLQRGSCVREHTVSPPRRCHLHVAVPRRRWKHPNRVDRRWRGARGCHPRHGTPCRTPSCSAPASRKGRVPFPRHKIAFLACSSTFLQVITAEAAAFFCSARITFHFCPRKGAVKRRLLCFKML